MAYYTEQDHNNRLPIANIDRIMRKALPNSAKISKEANKIMLDCVSEFISFITSEGQSSYMPRCSTYLKFRSSRDTNQEQT